MSQTHTGASGAPEADPSGNTQNAENETDKTATGPVSYETYKKTLGQLKTTQQKMADFEKRITDYEARDKQLQEQKLTQSGEWQKVLELREQQIAELNAKLNESSTKAKNLEDTLVGSIKLQTVLAKLPAPLADNSYMQFIEVDKVVLNPETGEIDEASAEIVAQDFVKKHARLLSADAKHLPNGNAKAAGRLSYQDWLRLPLNDRRARVGDVEGFPKRQ